MSVLVSGLLALITQAVGDQQHARARLSYEVDAPSCPDRTGFAASVAARLGYSPFDETAERTARVRLVQSGPGLRGTLELREGTRSLGRREFASPTKDCQELASSVSLALAIALDPQHLDAPAPAPRPTPPPVAERVPEPAPPAPQPVEPPPVVVGVGAFGALSTGLTPLVTGGGGFELAGRWGVLELVGRGRVDATVGVVDLEVGALSGSLAVCGVLPWLSLCAVGAGSALTMKGPAATATQGVGLFGGRLTARFEPVQRLWLLPFVELLAVLTRVTALSGDEVLWTTPPLSFGAGLTIRYDFVRELSQPRPNIL